LGAGNGNMKRKGIDITEFLLWVGIVILINIIVSQYFFRIDLTEDDRYTISDSSKEILKSIDDVVYIEVYLTGDQLPADYKRLERSLKETMDEFRVYAGNNVQYKFLDPNKDSDPERQSKVYQYLSQKGIKPTSIATNDGERYVFPGALIVYKEKEVPLILLKGNKAAGEAEMINQSIENLEYELISGIRQLTISKKKSIAFTEGHGEYEPTSLSDLSNTLSSFYNVYSINLKKIKSLENYEAVVVARPETAFSEEEKYLLDQYVMGGGNVLFFIDPLHVSMDSIGESGTLALPYTHNLDDMLFKYGIKLNENLIQDIQATLIPMYVGEMGNKPQIRMMPWNYYPLLNNFGDHPTVKNIDVVYSKFASTLDTVKAAGVNKTPLVFSSKYSKVLSAPVRVDLNEARKKVNPEEFADGPYTVSYLLEGNFQSLYKNRPLPVQDKSFKAEGKKARILITSDADIIKNEISKKGNQLQEIPLKQGNKDFVTNVVDYMLDEQGLISVRAKEITLRPLDKVKVKDDKLMWQIINLVLPVLLILLFGIIRFYIRKKKYESFK
jgi:gliding-associated putative ABC transporter substrate-binding component GldG